MPTWDESAGSGKLGWKPDGEAFAMRIDNHGLSESDVIGDSDGSSYVVLQWMDDHNVMVQPVKQVIISRVHEKTLVRR